MKSILIILSAALVGGCVYPRPGVTNQRSGSGVGRVAATVIGAGAGAYIGEKQGGSKGALIGAAGGALVTNVAMAGLSNLQNNQIEEAAETARREERVRIMNDYYESHAVNGGNSPQQPQSGGATQNKTAPLVYPPGVYDGVLKAPHVESVPTTR